MVTEDKVIFRRRMCKCLSVNDLYYEQYNKIKK